MPDLPRHNGNPDFFSSLLVVQNAIPADMFNAANTEHFVVFAKLRPFLVDVRTATRYPDYLANLERVVGMMPQAEERIAIFERYLGRQRTLASEGKQRSSPQINGTT